MLKTAVVKQAIKESGFNITIGKAFDSHWRVIPGQISLLSHEPREKDHGPFWRILERLEGEEIK